MFPQRTVLGPLLFLCHIKDLPAYVSSQVRLLADDCLLYREIRTQAGHAALQEDLKKLEAWAKEWGMEFNAKKCCCIMSVRHKSPFFHQLDKQILQRVAAQPYLGVEISENLSWSVHMDKIAKKANASLGMLRRNLRFCPETCRKTAYTSLVRSLLQYSSIVWDPHIQKEIEKIEGIQRRAARYIKRDCRSRNPGCVTAMLQELGLPSLQERRRQNRLTFLFKIIEGHLPGIEAEKYLTPILNKRLISPTRSENQVQKNVVQQLARNHQ